MESLSASLPGIPELNLFFLGKTCFVGKPQSVGGFWCHPRKCEKQLLACVCVCVLSLRLATLIWVGLSLRMETPKPSLGPSILVATGISTTTWPFPTKPVDFP